MHDTHPTFSHACALLLCHKTDLVRTMLDDASDYAPLERVYLRAWLACQADQANALFTDEWEVAEKELRACNGLGDTYQEWTQDFTMRRKRPWICWLLGNLADILQRHEVLDHYAAALRLLNERRMDVPWLHTLILLTQGDHLLSNGCYNSAHVSYEQALARCPDTEAMHDMLIAIHTGLSKTYRHQGNLDEAIVSAKRALRFYDNGPKRKHTSLLYALGELHAQHGQLAEAIDVYRQALLHAQSTQHTTMLITCWLGLALASLQSQAVPAARSYCIRALEHTTSTIDARLRGTIFAVCGTVAHTQAEWAEPAETPALWKEAVTCYLQALSLRPRDAEVLGHLASLLEDILAKDAEALALLKDVLQKDAFQAPHVF